MKTLEFEGTISANGQIAVPPEMACQIPSGEPVRVVVLWEASDDDAWRATGRRHFEAAYAPEDSVYEHLIDDAPGR
jgi:hypothetical protein